MDSRASTDQHVPALPPALQLVGVSVLVAACAGEGGAGTWSDGKLTTRIGAEVHCYLRHGCMIPPRPPPPRSGFIVCASWLTLVMSAAGRNSDPVRRVLQVRWLRTVALSMCRCSLTCSVIQRVAFPQSLPKWQGYFVEVLLP